MQADIWILFIVSKAAIPVGLYAFVHALMQRADAFTAANKLTKPSWLAITGGATIAVGFFDLTSIGSFFWIAGLVAALVYIVDVKPKLIELQRGSRG